MKKKNGIKNRIKITFQMQNSLAVCSLEWPFRLWSFGECKIHFFLITICVCVATADQVASFLKSIDATIINIQINHQ